MANMNFHSSQLSQRGGKARRGLMPRGFTLVEILVVIVILGIAAAVIIPSMGSRDDLKVAAAARVLMADLIFAQNKAISTQRMHYVTFSTAAPQNYRLVTDLTPLTDIPHPVTQASSYVVNFGAGGMPGLETISLGTVDFEGKTTIAFDELGVPYYYDPVMDTTTALATSGGSSIQLRCGTQVLRIIVEPYTGELRIE